MKIKPRKTPYSLTGRLLWTIGALMAVVSTIFWYFLITYQEKELIANFVKYGMSFVDNVRKTTRYGMLTFQEILIQQLCLIISRLSGRRLLHESLPLVNRIVQLRKRIHILPTSHH